MIANSDTQWAYLVYLLIYLALNKVSVILSSIKRVKRIYAKNDRVSCSYLTFLGAVLHLFAATALFHLGKFLAATGALLLGLRHIVFRLFLSVSLYSTLSQICFRIRNPTEHTSQSLLCEIRTRLG